MRPPVLFALMAALALFCGILYKEESVGIQFHDTYFVISVLYMAVIIGGWSVLAALVYYVMEGFKRPVKPKTGFWHFGLWAAGLFPGFIALRAQGGNVSEMLLLISIIFLLAGTAVFFYGGIKALLKRPSET